MLVDLDAKRTVRLEQTIGHAVESLSQATDFVLTAHGGTRLQVARFDPLDHVDEGVDRGREAEPHEYADQDREGCQRNGVLADGHAQVGKRLFPLRTVELHDQRDAELGDRTGRRLNGLVPVVEGVLVEGAVRALQCSHDGGVFVRDG
mgnify:CR=1 FL=1